MCESSVLTINPTTFEVTNEWSYASDLLEVACTGLDTHDFSITVRKDPQGSKLSFRSTVKISFSCEHRGALITSLLSAKAAALAAADPAAPPSSKAHRAPGANPAFAGTLVNERGTPTPVAIVVCTKCPRSFSPCSSRRSSTTR